MGCGWWNYPTPYKEDCYRYFIPKPITNADCIRAMSDEELVRHLACQWKECKNMDVDCEKCLLDWLREEISE